MYVVLAWPLVSISVRNLLCTEFRNGGSHPEVEGDCVVYLLIFAVLTGFVTEGRAFGIPDFSDHLQNLLIGV